MEYYVFLNDNETFSHYKDSTIVQVPGFKSYDLGLLVEDILSGKIQVPLANYEVDTADSVIDAYEEA